MSHVFLTDREMVIVAPHVYPVGSVPWALILDLVPACVNTIHLARLPYMTPAVWLQPVPDARDGISALKYRCAGYSMFGHSPLY